MVRNFYKFFCKIYSVIITFFENKFLKIQNNSESIANDLYKYGYQKINLKNKIVEKIEEESEIKNNEYIKRIIIERKNLIKILERIFVDFELSEKLTSITNFNYSIDYITYYKTIAISDEDKHLQWYANHWHIDQPFSENSLKIIFSLKKIDNISQGGIQILDKINSKIFKSLSDQQRYSKSYKMKADETELVIFNPNTCYHKAGSINGEYEREQIMIQLNPSKYWQLNSNIYNKQYKIEPKFPFFSYFFDKKMRLNK